MADGRTVGTGNPSWALSIPACSYRMPRMQGFDSSLYGSFLRVMFAENTEEQVTSYSATKSRLLINAVDFPRSARIASTWAPSMSTPRGFKGHEEPVPQSCCAACCAKSNKALWDFPGGAVVKNTPTNAGDTGSSPGPGRPHMPRSN